MPTIIKYVEYYLHSLSTILRNCDLSVVLLFTVILSRVCFPAIWLAPSCGHSRRPLSFPANSHYANENAANRGESLLRIGAKSTSRAQGG